MSDTPQEPAAEDEREIATGITGECRCHEGFKCRRLIDPSCVYHDCADEIVDALRAAYQRSRLAGREEAAKWHDQRWRDTPDAFEMEFHQVSAKRIRSLPQEGA